MKGAAMVPGTLHGYYPRQSQHTVAETSTMSLDKSLLEQMEDMAVFALVVEQGSFSGAGRRLDVVKSAVSRRVDRLERSLGVKLLQRSTRALSMTEAGQALHARALQSLALLEEARNELSQFSQAPRRLLRVTASVAFGRLCVAPLLPEFLAAYPELRVQLALLDRMVDLAEEGYDLALRLTRTPPDAVVARPLMPIRYVVCAAPAYLHGRMPAHPRELAALNCLSYGYQSLADEWAFQRGGERETVKVRGNVLVNSSEVVRDLMLAGVGVGLVARYAVEAELRAGRLVEALPGWTPAGTFGPTAYALWLPQPHLPPKIRVFVEFLTQRLQTPTSR
jgi:DNA-binding transcriptional LysR family regulator